ncbi:hypothetical protein [Ferrimonas pelagia]|uniref:Glycoamylase-like domain-containing protein n=1 Tax=Ferrimonas pelagia TaxID=1177826 RepID=A0ABP9ERI9_9GAMM
MKLKASLTAALVALTLQGCSRLTNDVPSDPVAPHVAHMSDSDIIAEQFRNNYRFWQAIRQDNGTYLDGYHLEGESVRGSIANAGMGLVALTVGHKMGWEPGAEALALQTLQVMAGKDPDIQIPRTESGTYIHFYNTQTGATIGDDWSPIDSAIMISGALFAKRYWPDNAEIAALADEVFATTDLMQFVADADEGLIWLATHADGSFKQHRTKAYNEYMIVANLAYQQAQERGYGADHPAIQLWNTWYANTDTVAKANYRGIEVPSESRNWFVSMFNHQFNNFLVHHFASSDEYQQAISNAAKADYTWWQDRDWGQRSYEWGSGAGACQRGYCVDRITLDGKRTKHDFHVVTPHIVAGFLPYSEHAKDDLLAMYRDERQLATYQLKDGSTVLWRYSLLEPEWRANAIQAVDYSSMLFGLAAMDEHLGMDFFRTHNNYFAEQPAQYGGR